MGSERRRREGSGEREEERRGEWGARGGEERGVGSERRRGEREEERRARGGEESERRRREGSERRRGEWGVREGEGSGE